MKTDRELLELVEALINQDGIDEFNRSIVDVAITRAQQWLEENQC